jgi:membrane protein DedA with SNARE-associated domain
MGPARGVFDYVHLFAMDRSTLKLIALPLVLLAIFVSLYAIWYLLDLPPEATLIPIAKDYFARYGLATVFVSAIVEGLLLIGWYFPGTIVLVLALILAGDNPYRVAEIAVTAVAGLSIAYTVNFFVGKHGWYRIFVSFGLKESLERAKDRLGKYGLSAIFTTYWQFNLASLTSTAAGILQFPADRFLVVSLVAAAAWMTFWSSLIYFFGQAALALVSLRVMIAAVAIWIAARLLFTYIRERNNGAPKP